MLRADRAGEQLRQQQPPAAATVNVSNFVIDAIVRHRRWLFGFLVLLYLISFNGQWRIGLDSAIYRGLAASLAQGNGFQFGPWASDQVYPGLPLLFAGINTLTGAPPDATHTGNDALAFVSWRLDTAITVGVILLMGSATIALVYKLIRLHYPQWVAITIAFGVASNAWFLKLCHELLTDIPFILGTMMTLYGWELLQRAITRREKLLATLFLAPGLLLASSMRPTFWILALALAIVCLWGVAFGRRRQLHAICLILLVSAWLLVQVIDPRERGFNPLAGGYEREALVVLPERAKAIAANLYDVLRNELPASFFGQQMAPVSIPASLLVLGSSFLLFRRHALWTILVVITFGVTLLLSAQPRYYTMVLPMLLLGWLLMLLELVKRLPPRWGTITLAFGLALVTLNNLSDTVGFIVEQRAPRFLVSYKDGKYLPTLRMCDLMIQRVQPDGRILAPSATIMSYVTGMRVYSEREVLGHLGPIHYPLALSNAGIRYAVFPGRVYRDKQMMTAQLIARGLLAVEKKLGSPGGEMWLARVRIIVPDQDWRDLPRVHTLDTRRRAVRPSS